MTFGFLAVGALLLAFPAGDTFWTQSTTAATPAAGTAVTLNDTAPTADRWNFAAVEILGP